MKRGFQQGTQQGTQQGFQQGVQQTVQQLLLEALQVRFGTVPERMVEAINEIGQPETLKFLHKQAITIASLAEFEQLLEKQ